ncbi:MAG TPA: MYXO-CTERM sorting domain-containing protein, partial [Polyangia bacterium]
IALDLELTQALPAGSVGTAEVWVGTGCDDFATRTNTSTPVCEKIASLSIQDLSIEGNGAVEIPLPSRALFSPLMHDCNVGAWSHEVYLVVYDDPAHPLASCTLNLSGGGAPPAAPTDASAERRRNGDIVVSWTPQGTDPNGLDHYDVVCAHAEGPWALRAGDPYFSACIDGAIVRRAFFATDGTRLTPPASSSSESPLFPPTPAATCGQAQSGDSSLTINGLAVFPDDRFEGVVVHSDALGNGTPSPPFAIGPVPTGGCAIGGTPELGPLGLVAVALLMLLRRRRAA